MRIIYFSIGLMVWSLSGFSADVFHYRAWGYPKTRATCQQEADRLAERIHNETGVEIYEARCESSNPTYTIDIAYLADAPLTIESTLTGSDYPGAYMSPQSCGAALRTEMAQFQRATGKNPFIAYCYKVYRSSHPWVVRIEAFGVGKKHMHTFGAMIDYPTAALYESKILEAARAAGVDAATVTLHGDFFKPHLTLRYYAKKRLPFNLMEIAHYAPDEVCTERIEGTLAVLQKTKARSLALFCGRPYSSSGATMYWFNYQGEEWVGRVSLHRHYPSFELCEADRDSVIDFMKKKMKRPGVFAVLCEGKRGDVISTPLERSKP